MRIHRRLPAVQAGLQGGQHALGEAPFVVYPTNGTKLVLTITIINDIIVKNYK